MIRRRAVEAFFITQRLNPFLLRQDKIASANGVEEERKPQMATYITLMNFTDQGIRNVKDSAKRAEAFKEAAMRLGVTVKDIYWTLGQYDIVATVEGPDDPSVTALGLALGALGNVHTQTPGAEYAKWISRNGRSHCYGIWRNGIPRTTRCPPSSRSEPVVRIASRHPERVPTLQSIGADINDEAAVAAVVAGAYGMVNAVSLYLERGTETFHALHVIAAERLARQAQRAGVERLV